MKPQSYMTGQLIAIDGNFPNREVFLQRAQSS